MAIRLRAQTREQRVTATKNVTACDYLLSDVTRNRHAIERPRLAILEAKLKDRAARMARSTVSTEQ